MDPGVGVEEATGEYLTVGVVSVWVVLGVEVDRGVACLHPARSKLQSITRTMVLPLIIVDNMLEVLIIKNYHST